MLACGGGFQNTMIAVHFPEAEVSVANGCFAVNTVSTYMIFCCCCMLGGRLLSPYSAKVHAICVIMELLVRSISTQSHEKS